MPELTNDERKSLLTEPYCPDNAYIRDETYHCGVSIVEDHKGDKYEVIPYDLLDHE